MQSPSAKRSRYDYAIYLALVLLGATQIVLSRRSPDFVADAYYFELANSILQGAGYGFNMKIETMLPPGFPLLLSLLIITLGTSYVVLIRAIAVFTTLALVATYELLRIQQDRKVAAVACLLLGSSPLLFGFTTNLVFSDMPYCFVSTLLLCLLLRLGSTLSERKGLWILCVALVLASILMRSTGIALIGGMAGWMAISFFRERNNAWLRLKILLPLMFVGIATQVVWMTWAAKHEVAEWPVHGYQEHYVAQLKLKSGNNPELGFAGVKDILLRPIQNADDISAAMVGLFFVKQTSPAWYSPLTQIPLALLLVGLADSFWEGGGGLLEWYFVCYEGLFLFWPWDFELRFLLPVAPLAFLYMWRGAIRLWRFADTSARRTGLVVLTIAMTGFGTSVVWGSSVARPQLRWCLLVWILVGAASGALLWRGRELLDRISVLAAQPRTITGWTVRQGVAVGCLSVACLIVAGSALQIRLGLGNLRYVPESDPDIESAKWLGAHSPTTAVILARKEDLVFHFSRRRVIWFPPSSDANMLMSGIERYHVQYVVVSERENSYWRPSDEQSFHALTSAFPGMFLLVHQGPHGQVFAISPRSKDDPVSLGPIPERIVRGLHRMS